MQLNVTVRTANSNANGHGNAIAQDHLRATTGLENSSPMPCNVLQSLKHGRKKNDASMMRFERQSLTDFTEVNVRRPCELTKKEERFP